MNDNRKPNLLRYASSTGTDGSFAEGVTELALDAVKAVEANLNQQLRYGKVSQGPISIDYLDGNLGNVGKVRSIVIVGVFPLAAADQISEVIKDAVDTVFAAQEREERNERNEPQL